MTATALVQCRTSRFVGLMATLAAALTMMTSAAWAQAPAFQSERISVETMGQGPDVILVPGYASSREVWRPTAQRLSSHYRVHLVQLAGFAGEAWSHGDGPLLQPAQDELARYASGLDRPAYIGHSMGGLMGLKLAQDHPALLSRVMSVDSLPFYGSLFGPEATVETVRPAVEQMKTAILNVPDALFRQQQEQTAVAMTLTEARRGDIVEASMASNRQALATGIAEVATTDARAGLSAMTTPVWAIYAVDTSSPYGAMAGALWTREYRPLPNVRLEAVEGSRHFIMFDQPERLNALIDQFLMP